MTTFDTDKAPYEHPKPPPPLGRLTLKQNLALRWQGLMLLLFPKHTAEALAKGIGKALFDMRHTP